MRTPFDYAEQKTAAHSIVNASALRVLMYLSFVSLTGTCGSFRGTAGLYHMRSEFGIVRSFLSQTSMPTK